MQSQELIPKQEIVVRKEGEDAFLFDPDTGNLLCVNRLGYFIWDCLIKKCKKEGIIRRILEEHEGVTSEKANSDYEAFIANLKDNSFLGVKRPR